MLAGWLKRTANGAYLVYKDKFPIDRGKYRVGWLLHKTVGLAPYQSEGIEYELSPVSHIDEQLIRGAQHDPVVTEQLHKYAQPGDYVVDIGANIGIFSLQASPLVGATGRVYAFEPSPREYVRLLRHIEINHFDNIIPIASGVADRISDEVLHLAWMGNPGQNSLFEPPFVERTARCNFGPLATFIPTEALPRIKVIKIDVEGAEMSVLRGIAEIMPQLTNAVFVVEIFVATLLRAGDEPKDIYDFFEQHGYEPTFGLDTAPHDEVFTRKR